MNTIKPTNEQIDEHLRHVYEQIFSAASQIHTHVMRMSGGDTLLAAHMFSDMAYLVAEKLQMCPDRFLEEMHKMFELRKKIDGEITGEHTH